MSEDDAVVRPTEFAEPVRWNRDIAVLLRPTLPQFNAVKALWDEISAAIA